MTAYVIQAAADCVRPGGRVAFNYLIPDFREDGPLYAMVSGENKPPLSPPLWDEKGLNGLIAKTGLMKVKGDTRKTTWPIDVIEGFYLVPAMSNSLFPKMEYPQRKERVEKLFSELREKGVSEMEQAWNRVYCVKPEVNR